MLHVINPMAMIVNRVLVIGGEAAAWEKLQPTLSKENRVGNVWRVDHYPSPEELARIVRLFPPDVVFLGLESASAASGVMNELETQLRGTPVVAFNRLDDSRAVTEWMRSGVREIVKAPFERDQIQDVLRRMAAITEQRPLQKSLSSVYAFLPARCGAGTSTLACHLSKTLAESQQGKVLLTDFDLVSSSVRFVLNFNHGLTIRDAIDGLGIMDEWRWEQIIARLHRLDVLTAGKLNTRRPLRADGVRKLLEYVEAVYHFVCADLSGNMESYSLEVLRSAHTIFVVTTGDPLSLGAARDKAEFLDSLGLKARSSLLLRETPQSQLPSASQAEKLCGLSVSGVFDYRDFKLKHADDETSEIPLPSGLKRQLLQMAKAMVQTNGSAAFQRPVQNTSFAAGWM